MKWLKWGGIILLVFIIVICVYKQYECKTIGSASQKAYRCPFFCSDPEYLIEEDQYHTMKEGKCYEVSDYGTKMSIRRVELEYCGEKAPVLKSESLAEFTYLD